VAYLFLVRSMSRRLKTSLFAISLLVSALVAAPEARALPEKILGYKIGNHILIAHPAPSYPPEAVARQQEGHGIIRMHVRSDGTVSKITFRKSTGYPLLDTEARSVFMKWRFRPEKTPFVTELPCDFDLHSKHPPGATFVPKT
jgi:TonB family protein